MELVPDLSGIDVFTSTTISILLCRRSAVKIHYGVFTVWGGNRCTGIVIWTSKSCQCNCSSGIHNEAAARIFSRVGLLKIVCFCVLSLSLCKLTCGHRVVACTDLNRVDKSLHHLELDFALLPFVRLLFNVVTSCAHVGGKHDG